MIYSSESFIMHNQLPPEMVYEILSHQFRGLMSNDHPPSPEKYYSNLKIFLKSNSTVNKIFYHVSRVLTYRYLNFTTARCFHKVLEVIKRDTTGLRKLIEVADFQELSSIGLGRTQEMNKMIKNLTNETLFEFLLLTAGNLREFLASEHIQSDLNERIIYFLIRPASLINVVDFCGCSGTKFTEEFNNAVLRLYEGDKVKEHNYHLTSIGFNDCTDLSTEILGMFLNTVLDLRKLDLSHSSINGHTLLYMLPHWKNLSHLSFADCLQLTPKTILEFFSYHPTITDNNCKLQWLNLKAHKHNSSWTETQTMFLLKKLCRYGHNKALQYLNIDGLPLHYSEDNQIIKTPYYYQCQDTLTFIKWNFPNLKSLSISKLEIPIEGLVRFLSDSEHQEHKIIEYTSQNLFLGPNDLTDKPKQQLKFLSVARNSYLNRWTISDSSFFTCSDSLVAIEVPFECWQEIESLNGSEIICMKTPSNTKSKLPIIPDYSTMEQVKWKCYVDASYGRRHWIYKVDNILNAGDIDARGSIIGYDSQGNKIIDIVKQPDFLKFAQNKIMLGCGVVPLNATRRKMTYRDLKNTARVFNNVNKFSLSVNDTAPVRTPTLPPGAWRVIHNADNPNYVIEGSEDEILENNSAINEHASPAISNLPRLNSTRDGLYWDTSVTDFREFFAENSANISRTASLSNISTRSGPPMIINGSDEYYEECTDPELQRRRSQFNLFHSSFFITNPERGPLISMTFQKNCCQHYSRYNQTSLHANKFVNGSCDSCSSFQPSEEYIKYLQTVEEYEVFGCIERGMYKYYSLKI